MASEVIVPESTEPIVSSQITGKRRQLSIPEVACKRPRVIHGGGEDDKPLETWKKDQSERRRSGQSEERKRGQRLFGALLGTLSQSSSSAANKRRTDIEKKQQAKLKLQAEEDDEKRKQQLDTLVEIRRREHKKYDKQSVSGGILTNEQTSFWLLTISIRCKFATQTSWPLRNF